MTEIYSIGKVLYRTTDPAKYAEYTFSKLLKKVRNAARNAAPADNNAVTTNTNTATN
jgi:tRNA G46 methylase TrmB